MGGMFYSPPASPQPVPVMPGRSSMSAYDYYSNVPATAGNNTDPASVSPLFPANDAYYNNMAYVPGMNQGEAARGGHQDEEEEDVPPNELWLRRHHSTSSRARGTGRESSYDDWMPRPSQAVHIQAPTPTSPTAPSSGARGGHQRQVSLSTLEATAASAQAPRTPGSSGFDQRRVTFAWGHVKMSQYWADGTTYEDVPPTPLSPSWGAGAAGKRGSRRATEQDFGIVPTPIEDGSSGNEGNGQGGGGGKRFLKRGREGRGGRNGNDELEMEGEIVDEGEDEDMKYVKPRKRGR